MLRTYIEVRPSVNMLLARTDRYFGQRVIVKGYLTEQLFTYLFLYPSELAAKLSQEDGIRIKGMQPNGVNITDDVRDWEPGTTNKKAGLACPNGYAVVEGTWSFEGSDFQLVDIVSIRMLDEEEEFLPTKPCYINTGISVGE